MAYDEKLTQRIREIIGRRKGFTEQKMFGGMAFMYHGNMFCGPVDDKLMVRLGAEGATAALKEKHVTPMDFTGKPMKTMVFVLPAGIKRDGQLEIWIERAIGFAKTLPRKKK